MSSGLWIVIEGIDATGKSEVVNFLKDNLQPIKQTVLFTQEPGQEGMRGVLREIVTLNQLTSSHQEALFYFDRYYHLCETVLPALARGCVVIQERGACSTLVYQGWAHSLSNDELKKMRQRHLELSDGRLADHLILLDCRPDEIGKRKANSKKNDCFESQQFDFQQKIRSGYLSEYQHWGEKTYLIDTTFFSLREIQKDVLLLVNTLLRSPR